MINFEIFMYHLPPTVMKKILATFAFVLVFALSGCRGGKSGSALEAPVYNPYVEAFTSGKVSRVAGVHIIFSQEPDQVRQTSQALSKAMSLKPSVSGRWEWQDERTAVFRPAGEFRRGTRYTVSADLRALFDAEGGDRKFSFDFETLPLALRASPPQFSTSDTSDGNGERYEITLDIASYDAEPPETVEGMVTVSEAAMVQWAHGEGGTSHTMLLQGVEAGAEPRNIVITAQGGELATVYIPAKTEFGVYGATYISYPEKYIEVTFTKALDQTQSMHGLAYIAGNDSETVTVEGNRLRLYPDNDANRTVEVFLSANIRSAGGLTLGEDNIRQVEVSGETPAFRFVGQGVVIPRSSELSIPFEAVWLRGVTVSVTRIYERNAGQFLQTNNLDGSDELMRVGRLVARKTIWLDEQGTNSLSTWKTYAVDLRKLIEPEPGAIYRVELGMRQELSAFACDGAAPQKTKEQIAAEDEIAFRSEQARYDGGYYYYYSDYYDVDWERYTYDEREDPCAYSFYVGKKISRNVLATDLGLIVKTGRTGEMTVIVHNLLTAAPMGGVSVEAFNFQGQVIASGVTGADGTAMMALGAMRPWYVRASHDTQRTYLRVDAGTELSTSSFDVSGEAIERGIKGFIYGDRGVWRPGDTMYLSFMLGDRAGTLPPNVPVVMELYDPTGQLYLRKTATRGEMGLYSFEMPTEPDARTGAWSVQVEVGGATFTKRVRVETIKPNRLKIDLKFPSPVVQAGKPWGATLHGEWLTGAKAGNLKYTIETSLTEAGSAWAGRAYEKYVFNNAYKKLTEEQAPQYNGTTDADGNTVVDQTISGGDKAGGMLYLNLTTRLFEPGGEASIDGQTILYSPFGSYVGIRPPDGADRQLDTDKKYSFSLATITPEAKAAGGRKVEVRAYKVQWYWWWDAEERSGIAQYISNRSLRPVHQATVTTDEQGRGTFPFQMGRSDWGTYYVTAKDQLSGHESAVLVYLDWPNYGGRRYGESRGGAMQLNVSLDKQDYKVGDRATVKFPASAGSRAIISRERHGSLADDARRDHGSGRYGRAYVRGDGRYAAQCLPERDAVAALRGGAERPAGALVRGGAAGRVVGG